MGGAPGMPGAGRSRTRQVTCAMHAWHAHDPGAGMGGGGMPMWGGGGPGMEWGTGRPAWGCGRMGGAWGWSGGCCAFSAAKR